MQSDDASLIIFFIAAGILFYSGLRSRAGKTKLMKPGYTKIPKDTLERYDLMALSKFIGNFLLIVAAIFVLMGVAGKLFFSYINYIFTGGFLIIAVIMLYGIVFMNVGNKFKKQ